MWPPCDPGFDVGHEHGPITRRYDKPTMQSQPDATISTSIQAGGRPSPTAASTTVNSLRSDPGIIAHVSRRTGPVAAVRHPLRQSGPLQLGGPPPAHRPLSRTPRLLRPIHLSRSAFLQQIRTHLAVILLKFKRLLPRHRARSSTNSALVSKVPV